MKKILIACIVLMSTIHLYGQKRITITRSAAYPDNTGDRIHKIANDFATTVGNHLKDEYPMKIDSASLKITMKCFNDTVMLSYHVALIECDSNEAYYYFDRRGALSKDVRPYIAGADAEVRCANQALLIARAFKKTYGNILFQRYIDVDIKCNNGFTYALSEYFLAAKK